MADLSFEFRPDPLQEPQQDTRFVLSEKHQQAVELLSYPTDQLRSWMVQQYEENPLLEIADSHESGTEDPEPELDGPDSVEEDPVDWDRLVKQTGVGRTPGWSSSRQGPDREERFRAVLRQPESLQDTLLEQLRLSPLGTVERRVGKRIISHLNEDGWFAGTVEEIAGDLGVPSERVRSVLDVVQSFEPRGAAGRDLQEVLLLQLEDVEEVAPSGARSILQHHLEDLQKRSYEKIARALDLDPEDVQATADLVRGFEPHPGRAFQEGREPYLTPDVTVRHVNGKRVVLLQTGDLPSFRISPQYRALLRSPDRETRQYVKGKLRGALWIIRCVHQRHRTLHDVTSSILRLQKPFFESGVMALRPLILKDVAEDIDVHESTVSRAVQNKYLQCEQGLFGLSYFFSSGLSQEGDRPDLSSRAVKARIRGLVEDEAKTNPLSDRAIRERLLEDGVQIGRRTVSKYRDQLGITPRKLRRRMTPERTRFPPSGGE